MKLKLFFFLLLFLFFFAPDASYSQIAGTWNGELHVMNQTLPLIFRINGTQTTLSSPSQNAMNIPAKVVYVSSDSVSISIAIIHASYKAKLKNKKLTGIYEQNGYSIPLILEQNEHNSVMHQAESHNSPYKTKEISFKNQKDNATLFGTLTYPIGYNNKSLKKYPVVLLISGSGQQNRDEEIAQHKPFAVIADYFARHGIATLRYDDRGIGKSTGDVKNATTENNMRDAKAGLNYLRMLHQFGSVGLLGHSEGGMIAFMLAAQKKTDFIISLAGPGIQGNKILLYQADKIYPDGKYKKTFLKTAERCYDYIIAGKKLSTPEALISSVYPEAMKTLKQNGWKNFTLFFKLLKNPWLRFFICYNPIANIRKTTCPTMAVDGTKDLQIPAQESLESIKKNLPRNPHNLIKNYPGLNHLFQHCSTGSPLEYANISETISDEVLKDMANWIKKLPQNIK